MPSVAFLQFPVLDTVSPAAEGTCNGFADIAGTLAQSCDGGGAILADFPVQLHTGDHLLPAVTAAVHTVVDNKALVFAEEHGEDNFGCHNTDAHLRSSVIGRNVTIVAVDGEMDLGEFGRIHFIDWDQTRGRTRTVQVMVMGE